MQRISFALILITLFLSACAYTYIPPIPRTQAVPEPTFTVAPSSELFREARTLRLRLRVTEAPAADWVAVQWLGPRNEVAGSESVWFEPSPDPQVADFVLPEGVTLTKGEWRAVVSYRGQVARQFSVEVE